MAKWPSGPPTSLTIEFLPSAVPVQICNYSFPTIIGQHSDRSQNVKTWTVLRTHEPGQLLALSLRASTFRVSSGSCFACPPARSASRGGRRFAPSSGRTALRAVLGADGASRRLRRRRALRAAFGDGRHVALPVMARVYTMNQLIF